MGDAGRAEIPIVPGSVPTTHALKTRPSRPPDYQAENAALLAMAGHLTDSSQTALQAFVEIVQVISRAGSAGLSLFSEASDDFVWAATSGAWTSYFSPRTADNIEPRAVIIDRNAAQLCVRSERCYAGLTMVAPAIKEALLVPFRVGGKAVGTVWAIAHETARKFDREDVRLIESVTRLAVSVYTNSERVARREENRSLRDVNEQLVISAIHQHELMEQAQQAEAVATESRQQLTSELEATELLQETSNQLIGENSDAVLHERILDAAVAIMQSEYASIQVLDAERRAELKLLAHRGFEPEAARLWERVSPAAQSTCGAALRSGVRVVVPDVERCEFMAGSDDLGMYLRNGIAAVQSTPLVSRQGELLGMLSTHWSNPHQPSEQDLRLLDVLARQAADFIERSQAQAALRESDREFRALAEAVPVIVWAANGTGSFDWYNNRWYEYTGQTAEEAAGWGWQAAIHPDDLPRVMEAWPRAIALGETLETEFRLRRKDGIFQEFLTRARPHRNARGEIVRWYGSSVDIEVQKTALDQSQRVVATLQGAFLPVVLPHTAKVRFDASYRSAEQETRIGGDWFEATQLPDGRYLISVGDVTGHGLEASIIASRLRQAITDFAFTNDDPVAVLAGANRVLRFQNPDVYATAIAALVDRDCARLTYASAGHPPPLLALSADEPAQVLPYGGLPLGVADDLGTTSHAVDVPRGAVMAFYTDGITEFGRDVEAGEHALRIAVARLVGDTSIARPSREVQKNVLGEGSPTDDIAILIAQFSEIEPDALHEDPTELVKLWRFHSSDAYTAHSSRQEIAKFIRRFAADPNGVFVAELIIGEILANTVKHAPGLVEVHVDWSGRKPVLRVLDNGPGLRAFHSGLPRDVMDESGRGLFLIEALAEEVSFSPAKGYGTELRVVLPLARRDSLRGSHESAIADA